jgi:hypothetical protein
VDLKVEVLREDGTVLARVDSGKRHEPERLPNLFVNGQVLLRLSGGKGDGNLDEPYRLVVSSRPAEPGAEREPNGTAAQATALTPAAPGTGLVSPRADVDFWSAQGPAAAGGDGQLGITVQGVAGLTLEVKVQSLAGKDLGKLKVPGAVSATQRFAVPEGGCLVQVREATGRAANPRDRYSLTIAP